MDNKTFENVVPRRNESDRGNSFRMLPHTLEERTAPNHPPPSNRAFIASFAPVRHSIQPIRHNLPQIPTRASNPRTAVSKASLREPYPSQSYPHQKHELLIVPEIESMQDVHQWREEPEVLERKSFYPIAENLMLEPSKGFVKEKNLGRGDFPGDSFPPGMHVGGILQDSMRIDALESDPTDIKCMEWKEKSAMWKESESNRDNQRFPSDPIKRKIRRDIQEMEGGLPLSNAFSTSTIVQKMESLVEAMPPVLPVSALSSQPSPQAYYFQGAAPSPPTPSFTQSGAVPSPSSRPKTGRAKTNAELKKQLMEKRAGQHLRGQGDGGSQASSPAPSHTEVPSPLSAPSPLSGPAEGSSPGVVDTDSSSNNGLKRSQETKNLKIENIVEPTSEPGSAGASSKWVVGDMMWARVAGHPWWPCMVSPDPVSGQFTKHVPRGQKSQYHVQFFGDEGERGWVPESSAITYEGQPAFESFCKQMITEHKKDRKNYQVPASRKRPWDVAVRAADQAFKISRQERIQKMLSQQTSTQPKAGESTITKAGKELEKSSSSLVVSEKADKTSGINKRRHSKSQDLKHGKEDVPTDLSPPARKKSRSVEPVGSDASEESHLKFPKNVSNQVIAQFTVFCQKRRESVKLENPEFSEQEIESRLLEQWNELDEETKSRFIPMGSDFTHLSQMMLNVGVPQVASSSVAKRSPRVVKPKKTSLPGEDESVKPKKASALAEEETSKPKRTSEERENPKRTSLSPEEGGAKNKKSTLPTEEAVRSKRTALPAEEGEVKPKKSYLSLEGGGVSPRKSCLPVDEGKEIAMESESVSQDSKEVSKPPGMGKTKDPTSTPPVGRGNAPSRAERRSKAAASTNDDKINGSSVQVPDKGVAVESKPDASSASSLASPPSSSAARPSDVPLKKRNKQVKMPDVEDTKERQTSKDGEKKNKDNPKKSENAEKVPAIDDMEIFEEVCFLCEKADDQIIQCQGPCRGLFHRECLGLPSDIPEDDIICSDCKSGTNKCFVCNKSSNKPILCSVTDCGRFYHKNCIKPTFFNPDNQKLVCPLHSCTTCRVLNKVTENPTEVDLDDVDFYECIRCPTAFHMMGFCLAAGSKYLAGNFVICSRHFEPSKTNNLHSRFGATWCFTCQKAGGTLISCETCPAAYHANCLKLSPAPSGPWQCNRCASGITPLPGDIVWVKFGSYRWWPAQIYFPYEVPKNIRDLPHQIGEFPVCFYGSRDYLWLHQGRVFPFKEGDKCCKEATAKGAGKVFDKAMEESIAAYRQLMGENADPTKSCSTTEKPSKGANRAKVGKSPKSKVEVKKEKKDNVAETKQERRSAQTRKEKSLEADENENSETRSKRSSDGHKVKSREVEKEKLAAQRLSEKNQADVDSKKSGKEGANEKRSNDTNGRLAAAKKDKLSHVRRSSTASKTRLSLERVRKRHSVKSEPVPFLYKQIGLVTAAPGFHENVCFWCNQSGGRLLNCDKVKCPKTYHVECLQMTKLPHGPWLCPWHHCTICGKASIYQCNQCPNAFCQDHFKKGITYAIDGSLICAAHPEAEFDEDEEEAAPVEQETKDGSIVDPIKKSSIPVESSASPEKVKSKPSLATKRKSRATYKTATADQEDSDSGASDGRLTIVEDAAVKPTENEKSAKRKRTEKSPKKSEKSPRRTEKSPRRTEKSQKKQDQNRATGAEDVPTLTKSPDGVTKSALPTGKVSPMFDNSDDEFPDLVIDVPTI